MSDEPKSTPTAKSQRTSAPRMPLTFKTGAHVYTVRYEKELKDEHGQSLHADTDDDNNIVRLERHMNGTKKQEIALHEVIHTCYYGVPGLDTETEEKYVSVLAPRLLQVLQDNPELIAFLQYKSPSKKKE